MFDYIIIGIIQGVTEFLPISSSGHLILIRDFVDIPQDLALDTLLHLATLLAVVVFYRKKILKLFSALINTVKSGDIFNYKNYDTETKMVLFLIVATIPTVLIGFTFKDFFENIRNEVVVAIMLFVGAAFMLLDVALDQRGRKHSKKIVFKYALGMGLAQPLALIPGTSRSGATIVTGSLMGFNKKQAADFSFLLSIPAILGAFIFQLKDIEGFSYFISVNIWVAFITSFFVGLLSIGFLLKVLNSKGFLPFAIYRILLAFLIILFFV